MLLDGPDLVGEDRNEQCQSHGEAQAHILVRMRHGYHVVEHQQRGRRPERAKTGFGPLGALETLQGRQSSHHQVCRAAPPTRWTVRLTLGDPPAAPVSPLLAVPLRGERFGSSCAMTRARTSAFGVFDRAVVGYRVAWWVMGWRGHHLRMLTARATTRTATTSEIASSAIISSLAHGRIAETSVGLNAVAVVNERWR